MREETITVTRDALKRLRILAKVQDRKNTSWACSDDHAEPGEAFGPDERPAQHHDAEH